MRGKCANIYDSKNNKNGYSSLLEINTKVLWELPYITQGKFK